MTNQLNWSRLTYDNLSQCVIFAYENNRLIALPLESLKKIPVHAKPEVVNEFVDDILTCKDMVTIENDGSSVDFEPCGISFSQEHFEQWLKANVPNMLKYPISLSD